MVHVRTKESVYPPSEAILVDVSANDQDFSANPLRGFSVGTAGNVKVDMPSATGIVLPANVLAVGIQHIAFITKIYNSGTTASEIVGWR